MYINPVFDIWSLHSNLIWFVFTDETCALHLRVWLCFLSDTSYVSYLFDIIMYSTLYLCEFYGLLYTVYQHSKIMTNWILEYTYRILIMKTIDIIRLFY